MRSPTRRRLSRKGSRCSGSLRTAARTSLATRVSTAETPPEDERRSLCQIPQADILPLEPLDRNAPRYSLECRSCRILLAPSQRLENSQLPSINPPRGNPPDPPHL